MVSLIPISDENPTRRRAWVTMALIAVNVVVYFLQPGPPSLVSTPPATEAFFIQHSPAPCDINNDCKFDAVEVAPGHAVPIPDHDLAGILVGIFESIFLHASILHVGGNMLFLWVFGNNVEDWLGRFKYLLFYLAGGLVSSLVQMLSNIHSVIGAVGASGAVAAVLGAYLVLYPRARINVLVTFFFITFIPMSAWIVLLLWVAFQIFVPQPGVAWQAHVGGFVFGAIAIFLLGGRPQRSVPGPLPRRRWRRGYY